MRLTALFLAILSSTLALALPTDLIRPQEWTPAANSTVICDKASDKIISFYVGPQKEPVLQAACKAMMPACAFPETEELCPTVLDWKLDGPKNSTQSVNVEDAETNNKLSGWEAKFSVTPASTYGGAGALVMWSKADCHGYFNQLVSNTAPNGCLTQKGSGTGSLWVGAASSLTGTEFKIEIVRRT
ncbi:hypothetical protein BU24DRAFT_489942 [Aaosphaeria arxii CBS 175.79]|uniref:Uncharacterized protein n=1 Tax=Aaosphaeria arxii CBS 175.79 TaxID=1450172 RepID=A0A6A5Y4B4_9PLEO|nr:uncharacterized protein BU24DRAFT_489942 [Aaosphaeria arxii CBS 175.79]KAF2020119.1 hypothetical protein BU24DRAFT_489942 [Aaosphaeria arxii CBS 175.79]